MFYTKACYAFLSLRFLAATKDTILVKTCGADVSPKHIVFFCLELSIANFFEIKLRRPPTGISGYIANRVTCSEVQSFIRFLGDSVICGRRTGRVFPVLSSLVL